MNRKGQGALGIGIIITVFITVIVGVILFQAIAQESGRSTSLTTVVEEDIGTITNGTAIYLDYRFLSDIIMQNGTAGGVVVNAGNWTLTNNIINPSNGQLSVRIVPEANTGYYGVNWFMNATAQPTTYVADSAGRAIVGLIAIFFALAIAIVALEPTLRSGVLNMLGK
tara:strand:+ start:61 stop:564 length:504 start_codon:yes stop_codon:yes gene_type:complete